MSSWNTQLTAITQTDGLLGEQMDISSGFGRLFYCMFPNQTTIAYSYRYTQHYTLKKRSIQVAVWSNEPGWQASATIREVLCNKVVGERQADLPCSDELERVACVFYCRPSSKYTECPFRRSYASWYARRSCCILSVFLFVSSGHWIRTSEFQATAMLILKRCSLN